MAKLIILGTASAIPTPERENTHMAVLGDERLLLIDSGNNPVIRLPQAGIDLMKITDMILTHFHPDHVSGVPSLLLNSWLMGRRAPLQIYGLAYTLDRLERLMDFYDWHSWPGFYEVSLRRMAEYDHTLLFQSKDFSVYASPVCHMIPNIGLRIEFPTSGKKIAYSCDSEPCPQVIDLAQDVDLLIHEATGATLGHSSASQAGEIAQQSGVKQLCLIHYEPVNGRYEALLEEAHSTFSGDVFLAKDLMEIDF